MAGLTQMTAQKVAKAKKSEKRCKERKRSADRADTTNDRGYTPTAESSHSSPATARGVSEELRRRRRRSSSSSSSSSKAEMQAHLNRASSEQPEVQIKSDQSTTTADSGSGGVAEEENVPHGKLNSKHRKVYKRLLEREVIDAEESLHVGITAVLPPSWIGASYWTAEEKEAFFQAIARFGQDDLPSLESHVGTKSAPEIRRYLLLLRDRAAKDWMRGRGVGGEGVPAAWEFGRRGESVLEAAADYLAREAFDREVGEEKELYGKWWLIREDDGDDAGSSQDSSSTDASQSTQDEQGHNQAPGRPLGDTKPPPGATNDKGPASPNDSAPADTSNSIQADELLDAQNLLDLSRRLFMNPSNAENWRTIEDAVDKDITSSPAIFRSAFEDLHQIVIDITRELVRATILQAQSRLRATDDGKHGPLVREEDARTASEVLGMKASWHQYWVKMARRCGLHVYTDSKRYFDGREGTKNGVRLTYEEVEVELGGDSETARDEVAGRKKDGSNVYLAAVDEDDSAGSDSVEDEDEEDAYLESLDQEASKEEQDRLLGLLGGQKSSSKGAGSVAGKTIKSEKRQRENEHGHSYGDWRKRTCYEPEWEWEMKYAVEKENDH